MEAVKNESLKAYAENKFSTLGSPEDVGRRYRAMSGFGGETFGAVYGDALRYFAGHGPQAHSNLLDMLRVGRGENSRLGGGGGGGGGGDGSGDSTDRLLRYGSPAGWDKAAARLRRGARTEKEKAEVEKTLASRDFARPTKE
jgi:hypothetical protein